VLNDLVFHVVVFDTEPDFWFFWSVSSVTLVQVRRGGGVILSTIDSDISSAIPSTVALGKVSDSLVKLATIM